MTKKLFRLTELAVAALLGVLTGLYRVSLAQSGAPLTFGGVGHSAGFLYALIALCIVGFAVCAIFLKERQMLTKGTGGRAYTALLVLSALTLFAAFAMMLGNGMEGLLQKVQVVFLAFCGVVILLKVVLGERHKLTGIFSLFPVYYLCLFLLQFYRENAKNPMVQSFALEVITIIALLAAIYVVASLKFERPRVRQQIFFTLTAVYLLVTECISALMYSPLVFTVPGMSEGILCVLAGLGIYVIAAFFLAPMQVVFEPKEQTEPDSEETSPQEVEVQPEDILVEINREELLRTILGDEEEDASTETEE